MARKFIIKEKEFHLGLPDIDKFSNPFFAQKVTWFFSNINEMMSYVSNLSLTAK